MFLACVTGLVVLGGPVGVGVPSGFDTDSLGGVYDFDTAEASGPHTLRYGADFRLQQVFEQFLAQVLNYRRLHTFEFATEFVFGGVVEVHLRC